MSLEKKFKPIFPEDVNFRDPRDIDPFAYTFLTDRRSILIVNGERSGGPTIDWPSREQDAALFSRMIEVVRNSADLNDRDFREQIMPQIQEMMNGSPLMSHLNSRNIVVNGGHQRGSETWFTPYEHSVEVAKMVSTGQLGSKPEIILLRLAPWFHDLGKMLSANIPYEESKALLAKYERKFSYPSHYQLSTLIFDSLMANESFGKGIRSISPNAEYALRQIILHHHFLEKVGHFVGTDAWEKIVMEANNISSQLAEVLVLTFLFSFADIGSNTTYWPYWQEAKTSFMAIWKIIEDKLSEASRDVARKILEMNYDEK